MTIRPQSYFDRWERVWLSLWSDKHAPFKELNGGRCVAPIPGGDGKLCCGVPTRKGMTLCLFHHDLKQSKEAQRAA